MQLKHITTCWVIVNAGAENQKGGTNRGKRERERKLSKMYHLSPEIKVCVCVCL